MESQVQQPRTLTEAIRFYSDAQTCINAVAAMRWIDGSPVCPKCAAEQGPRNHYWLSTQKRWKCYSCRKQFSVKVGTIFEDSPLALDVWLVAMWMLCNCRNGVSSYEIARATGIAQKSAWFVLQRLRFVMKETNAGKLGESGTPVEMDETFIGGKPKNMHQSKRLKQRIGMNGYAEKTAVFGMIERGRDRYGRRLSRTSSVRHCRRRFLSRWGLVPRSIRTAGRDTTASRLSSSSTKP